MLLLQHAHHGPQELQRGAVLSAGDNCQLPQLRIFVVGTFKNQLVEEVRLKEAVQDISKCLNGVEGKAILSLHPEGHSGPAMLSNQQHGRQGG